MTTIDPYIYNLSAFVVPGRDPEEIKSKYYEKPMAPEGVKCFNPAFDVTEAELISGIITEKGICRYPYTESLAAQMRDER